MDSKRLLHGQDMVFLVIFLPSNHLGYAQIAIRLIKIRL